MNILERLRLYKSHLAYIARMRKGLEKTAFVVGTPSHGNLGDSAIILAQKAFLEGCEKKVEEIPFDDMFGIHSKAIRKAVFSKDELMLPGGGNMGDVWFREEEFRWKVFQAFPKHHFIVFPQTIDYTDTPDGLKKQETSIPYYNRPEIIVAARERVSYEKMNVIYPNANILLTPDLVLSMEAQRFDIPRAGALLCMRSDKEKRLSGADEEKLCQALQEAGLAPAWTDTVIDAYVTKENREQLVTNKMRELASAKLVITDRLHGMVFCALTGTPCIVLSNNNHKVKGTYDWISYLPYIRYADSVQEAISYIPQLLELPECVYDNTPLQPFFEPLRQAVRRR